MKIIIDADACPIKSVKNRKVFNTFSLCPYNVTGARLVHQAQKEI